jgi:hypothetical protein
MNLIQRIINIVGNIEDVTIKHLNFLVLGYTDILLAKSEWLEYITEAQYGQLDNRENFVKLRTIHGRADVEKIPTWACVQDIVFKNAINFTFIDFQKYQGDELLLDLNYQIPEEYFERFNAVLDLGTSEHVFNYSQALMNCHLMAKVGAIIYHVVPLNWPNHGFYNLSPTIFYDFYSDNKAELIECSAYFTDRSTGVVKTVVIREIPQWKRFNLDIVNGREILLCIQARKNGSVQTGEFVYPIQRKYRDASAWI